MVKSAEELDGTNVENYSAIFIGGGNTYKLLRLPILKMGFAP